MKCGTCDKALTDSEIAGGICSRCGEKCRVTVHLRARVQPMPDFTYARCGYVSKVWDEFDTLPVRVTCESCLSRPAACAEAS